MSPQDAPNLRDPTEVTLDNIPLDPPAYRHPLPNGMLKIDQALLDPFTKSTKIADVG